MAKFKVGDKVRVYRNRDNHHLGYNGIGTTFVVEKVHEHGGDTSDYRGDSDGGIWSEYNLELAEVEKPKVLNGFALGKGKGTLIQGEMEIYVTKDDAKKEFANQDNDIKFLYEVTLKPIKRLKKGVIEGKI